MLDETEGEFPSEDECAVCRDLDPDERPAMREYLLEIPLCEPPVCAECLRAFTINIGLGFLIEEPTKH